MIDRCSFKIDNFLIASTYSNIKSFIWIKAIYQQTNTIILSNLSLRFKGDAFESYDPLSLIAFNIDIDWYQITSGFYISSSCDYANASYINDITFTNITAYNSVNRTVSSTSSLIYVYGGSNFTLSQSNISIYGSTQELYPPVQFGTITACNPGDGVSQIITIANNTFTLIQIDDNSRFTQIYSSIDTTYLRNVTVNMSNIIFNGIVMNLQPLISLYTSNKTTVASTNLSLSGASFADNIVYISSSMHVILNSYSFSNITTCKGSFIKIVDAINVDINQMSIKNCTLDTTDELYYFMHQSSQGYTNTVSAKFVRI